MYSAYYDKIYSARGWIDVIEFRPYELQESLNGTRCIYWRETLQMSPAQVGVQGWLSHRPEIRSEVVVGSKPVAPVPASNYERADRQCGKEAFVTDFGLPRYRV